MRRRGRRRDNGIHAVIFIYNYGHGADGTTWGDGRGRACGRAGAGVPNRPAKRDEPDPGRDLARVPAWRRDHGHESGRRADVFRKRRPEAHSEGVEGDGARGIAGDELRVGFCFLFDKFIMSDAVSEI